MDNSIATPELTPEQISADHERKWNDTSTMVQWAAPGFKHIWYKLLTQSHDKGASNYTAVMTHNVPVAATDGQNIMINPDTFFKYAVRERTFICVHEILHAMFDDVSLLHRCNQTGYVPNNNGGTLPFNNNTMQIAMDLRNNTLLVESRIGLMPKDAIKSGGTMGDGTVLPQVNGTESVLDIYEQVYKAYEQQQGGQPGAGPQDVLSPGTSTGQTPQQAANARNAQRWAIEIAAAQQLQEKHQGKLAGGLARAFAQLLEPEVSWLDHIETLIKRHTGWGGRDWRVPDSWFIGRDIYLPSKTGYNAGWIVVWGDTSGSRDDREVASNISELAAIIEDVQPKRLTVLWCDAAVHYIDEIEDAADLGAIQARGTGGHGGTDFQPVLDWIIAQDDVPELFIGFTDGAVRFPAREPPFPTIWASSADRKYPYGQVVRVVKSKA